MSTGRIKPKRMKRPPLPEKMTLMECVRWVMYAERCTEEQAKVKIADAINSGKLPFEANLVDGNRKFIKHGVFRARDGRFVEEH